MDYLNLHTSVLDSEEFKLASNTQRGTWLSLYRYCAGQENGGRIEAAKQWADRTWLQIAGVSLREVSAICRLWVWEGETLVLSFYNLKAEQTVDRLRTQAAAGAHARWHRKGIPDGMPQGMPSGATDGDAKGNGKEGNEKEYRPGNAAAPAAGHEAETNHTSKRSLKNGSTMPAEHPAKLAERMIATGLLKGRQAGTAWSAKELAAFKSARLDTCDLADFEAQLETMRGYYAAKIPREIDFRRRELQTLLNNWPGELDKARAYNRDNNDGIRKA